jgi:hypothetical protein
LFCLNPFARKEKGSADKPLLVVVARLKHSVKPVKSARNPYCSRCRRFSISRVGNGKDAEMVESRGFWVAWRYRKNQNRDITKQPEVCMCNQDKGFGVLPAWKKHSWFSAHFAPPPI